MKRSAMPTMSLLLLGACAGASVEARADPTSVHVTVDGEPFATVHTDAEPRPHVWPLYAAGGVPVTRDYPMAQREGEQHDHPHHQSLWFAHGSVDGFDFWHGSGKGERQALVDREVLPEAGRVTVRCDYRWVVDPDRTLLHERREHCFEDRGDHRTIEVRVSLRPEHGPITFGDSKEGTFALRVHPALRARGKLATGRQSNSEGQQGTDAWGQRARWIDDTGTVDGVTVGVAMFDHPSNLRHPTMWHVRDYGLLAANPFGAHDFLGEPAGTGDYVLPAGERLELRYLVVLHPGWDRARIEREYRRWAER